MLDVCLRRALAWDGKAIERVARAIILAPFRASLHAVVLELQAAWR